PFPLTDSSESDFLFGACDQTISKVSAGNGTQFLDPDLLDTLQAASDASGTVTNLLSFDNDSDDEFFNSVFEACLWDPGDDCLPPTARTGYLFHGEKLQLYRTYLLGVRYYNDNLHQFMSKDPVKGDP